MNEGKRKRGIVKGYEEERRLREGKEMEGSRGRALYPLLPSLGYATKRKICLLVFERKCYRKIMRIG